MLYCFVLDDGAHIKQLKIIMKKLQCLAIALLIKGYIIAQTVQKTMFLLPDTGQTTSYTATFDEDNDYNINLQSFTNNNNGTVSDNVTGLIWQQGDSGELTIEDAITYCDNLVLGGFSDRPRLIKNIFVREIPMQNGILYAISVQSPYRTGHCTGLCGNVQ